MLAMMFNYINEQTVMAGPSSSRVRSLFISARGERQERMMWSEGKAGLIIDHQVQVVVVVVVVVVSVCVGVSYWT